MAAPLLCNPTPDESADKLQPIPRLIEKSTLKRYNQLTGSTDDCLS